MFLAYFISLVFIGSALAFRIEIAAGQKESFHENLKKGQKFGVNFQVEKGGNYDIDFTILDPKGQELYSGKKESYGHYGFTASMDGKYVYEFSNEMSQVSSKKLSFSVQGRADAAESAESKADPLDEQLKELTNSLRSIQDEQEYIMNREKMHHEVAESSNSRVVWWSLFQTAFLIGVCMWQIYYLKRFFEVKRVV